VSFLEGHNWPAERLRDASEKGTRRGYGDDIAGVPGLPSALAALSRALTIMDRPAMLIGGLAVVAV
jgi:hypothetical protein